MFVHDSEIEIDFALFVSFYISLGCFLRTQQGVVIAVALSVSCVKTSTFYHISVITEGILHPRKVNVYGVYWNQPICPSICVPVCIQNTSFCQSAGGGIKSHSVTALVNSNLLKFNLFKGELIHEGGVTVKVFLCTFFNLH